MEKAIGKIPKFASGLITLQGMEKFFPYMSWVPGGEVFELLCVLGVYSAPSAVSF